MGNTDTQLRTVSQVAAEYGVFPGSVRRWIKDGDLEALSAGDGRGRTYLIPVDALESCTPAKRARVRLEKRAALSRPAQAATTLTTEPPDFAPGSAYDDAWDHPDNDEDDEEADELPEDNPERLLAAWQEGADLPYDARRVLIDLGLIADDLDEEDES